MKRVLVFGAGLVARPMVRYLLDKANYEVTVASRTIRKAEVIVDGHRNGTSLAFDIERDENLLDLVMEHDLAVSLLPYTYHVDIAKAAIKAGVDMVTTSYVSDGMRALDAEAKDAGILLLNEMGLDPGIDHMEAQRVIDEVHGKGGRIKGFISYCGGLPAPEANTNPWGYKFSWSPKGVVLASKNSARFKRDGTIMEVPGSELFAHYENMNIPGQGTFEGYPNRDSVPYAEIYGIDDTDTILRGTLRNVGWCDTWKGLHDIGILNEGPIEGKTYRNMMDALVPGDGTLEDRIIRSIDTRKNDTALSNYQWLGLLSDDRIEERASTMDALSDLLERKLGYAPGERDMIILQHTFITDMPEGEKTLTSTLIDHGIPGGDSSMSRTVGLPAAIGSELILNRALKNVKGVKIPILPEIYVPALERLQKEKIGFDIG